MQMQDPDQPQWQAIESHRDKGMADQYLKTIIQLDAQGRYVKLMNFEMEVTNILETRVFETKS